MGIKEKGFADWISTTFKESVKELGQTDISHFETVCIDINPLLHTCLRNATTEARFVKLLYIDLDRCLRLTIPQSTVYFAVDGSPPLAKMKEQIRRRKSKAPSKNRHLDSASITPGTAFMLRVTHYLQYYAARYLAKKYHTRNLRFIIDGAETAGEGEAKVMQFLHNNSDRFHDKLVAVFSGDSDVIIQSLLNSVSQIYVIRPGFNNFAAVSVSRLRNAILQASGCKLDNIKTSQRVIIDFSVLVMLSGNDYLRKLRGARMSKIWPVYRRFRTDSLTLGSDWRDRYLITGDSSFDYQVLHELLTRIRRLTNRSVFKPDMSLSLSMLGLSLAIPPPNNEMEKTSDDDEDDEDDDEDEEEMDPAIQALRKEQISPGYTKHIPNYLQSLLWTLAMYTTGQCPDVTFVQIGYYLTIEQILTFLARDLGGATGTMMRRLTTPRASTLTSIITIVCTITLLSIDKVHLIPEAWRPVFSSAQLRRLTHSMVHDAGLTDEARRVEELIYEMGQTIVSLVDPADDIVQRLTFAQLPTVGYQSQPSGNDKVQKVWMADSAGNDIWREVAMPTLPHDPTLHVHHLRQQQQQQRRVPPIVARRNVVEHGWPFKMRRS